MLDARSLEELAQICATDMVELFGCLRASVVGPQRVWAEYESKDLVGNDGVAMAFRLASDHEGDTRLQVTVENGPDVAIMRQQLMDLVAVVRRAWRDRRQLSEESRRA